jgi:deoxyribonuclease V
VIAITDVHYRGDAATAACVVAERWSDEAAVEERVVEVAHVEAYRPGAFYERELPCLLAVLGAVRSPIDAVVVDGYVHLDDACAPGLGAHLHAALGGKLPVIGVAKTAFRGATFAARVLRGESRAPLFVTAQGMAREEAARLVGAMHGAHRLPTLIGRVDRLARRSR